MQPAVPFAPWEVERALADVFARREFLPPPPSPITAWLREAWGTAKRLLGELFGGVNVAEGGQRVVVWIVIALLAAAGLGAALHLAGAATGVWRARERRPRGGVRSAPAVVVGAADWEARARAAADAGCWREAALALYQALLLRLQERGSLRYDASKTPGDYRRETRRDREAARVLDAFLAPFEPAAFGGRSLDAPGYGRLRDAAARAGAHG